MGRPGNLAAAGGWALLFAVWGLLPGLGMTPGTAVALSGILCALSCLGLVLAFSVPLPKPRAAIGLLVVCTGVNLGLNQAWQLFPGGWELPLYLMLDLSLAGMAVGAGSLISRGITSPRHLIPMVAVAAMADIWSVSFGLTREVVKSPVAMNHLLIHYPVPGLGIRPLLGLMDFVFAALFLSVGARFSLPLNRSLGALAAAFTGTILLAVLIGRGLPLLPAMGLAFVLCHYASVRMEDPREKKQALAAIVLIALVFTGLSLVLR